MEVVDVPAPGAPGPGEVVVRPEAVGICGSDLHLFSGELGMEFPRVQGHELSALVEEAGPGCDGVAPGDRVAVWPILSCGRCYPCRIGRESACAEIRILGVHVDGGFRERMTLPCRQVFPVSGLDPLGAALVEPVSIGVRTARRARIAAGERVAVLGAGPIGQAVCLAARARGASVLLADRLASRLEHGRTTGADILVEGDAADLAPAVAAWTDGEGAPVVVDTTAAPAVVRAALDAVATAGRLALVGLSEQEAALPLLALPIKELDLIGVSCCAADDFAEAVELVSRDRDRVASLVTHEFPFEQTPEAIAYAMRHPGEVMKAVIRMEG
jgi:L-gulonate 5-dehydrogenase